ncbi:MAG: sigma-54-dependent Fis family transcriptional regulator [Stomatobaculum sp.]|nr:sigma-54-dependent Fis family transcriptional regulator [Stomatobaculum sp.]
MKYRLLIVDDEHLLRMTLEGGMSDLGYEVRTAETIGEALRITEEFRPDAVLLDNRLKGETGLDHVEDFRRIDEDIMVILMTAYGSILQAVEAMKRGVSHYVQKPFDLEEVDMVIRRGMEQRNSRRSLEFLKLNPKKLIGVSPEIEAIRHQIRVLADNDNVDLLVVGETGTGKEVVVRTVHELSPRAKMPMVKINCGAIPESLLESELFGYEKGAFTGAAKSKKGLLELADGGMVFLDEVGELPLSMQAKLLTFLEDRRFRRVGGLQDIKVSVRVAAATNRDLEEEVREGRFREDLYYRLNVLQIRIPPLRERPDDVPVLCDYYLKHFNRKFGRKVTGISPEFMEALKRYSWKGNVRELRNVMERCVLFSSGSFLTGKETGLSIPAVPEVRSESSGSFPMRDLREGPVDLKKELDSFERVYIDRALELSEGNLSRAAQMLGCTRFTLKRRLEGAEDQGGSAAGGQAGAE